MDKERMKKSITYLKDCTIWADGVLLKQKMPKNVVFAVIKVDGIKIDGRTCDELDEEVMKLLK